MVAESKRTPVFRWFQQETGRKTMTDSAQPFAAKKFLEGPENGLYRRRRRRSHRIRAWKPDLILSVAQRHAGLSWPGPADCLRHDRNGRFRETPRLWSRPLHLRRAAQFSVRAVEKGGGR